MVIECTQADLATRITQEVTAPTIGIGAGNQCDGQVLVWHDLLGMNKDFRPHFAKAYCNLHETITSAISEYQQEVHDRTFPAQEHSRSMKPEEWQTFLSGMQEKGNA